MFNTYKEAGMSAFAIAAVGKVLAIWRLYQLSEI